MVVFFKLVSLRNYYLVFSLMAHLSYNVDYERISIAKAEESKNFFRRQDKIKKLLALR